MFGLNDFFSLVISVFIILPVVSIIRELGYYLTSKAFGAKDASITIGSGPHLFQFSIFQIRRFYFMYSWCTYDSLKRDTKWAHVIIYSSPMLANILVALFINALLANDLLGMETFWNRFVFYAFYFVLFDAIPMYYPDGQPSNGRVVYDLIRYGRRSGFDRSDPQMETYDENSYNAEDR
ncbi:hypothetical protein [Virgibacillus tibetensis]|uniref:hypothetical protein n=1 Tax=Virgibacillus tibetensis TaxID=3042313 RepID=UPI002E189C1E